MMDEENSMEMGREERLLQHLLHLKHYEKPEVHRMVRNRQNIMRQVRHVHSNRRRSLADLIEISIPWFFAEPRYGMALLLVVFAGLQFWGIQTHRQVAGQTGIYTSPGSDLAVFDSSPVPTNSITYPSIPDHFQLFPDRQAGGDVKFVGRFEPE